MQQEKDIALFTAYDDWEGHDPSRPEKNLLLAVLLSAINDLSKDGDAQRKATQFFLNHEDDYLFSFRTICDYLKIDPNRILFVTGLNKPK